MEALEQSGLRRIAILLTDGGDNSSFSNATAVVRKARAHNITVFVIGFGGADRQMLSTIAASTGGRAYFPAGANELTNIFSEIFLLLGSYYEVTYKPLPAQKGQIREVGVSINMHGDPIEGTTPLVPVPDEIDPGPRMLVGALFPYDRAKPEPVFYPHLRDLAKQISQKKSRIIIRGHTDMVGNATANYYLSLRRAQFIAAFLIHQGVASTQIVSVEAYGMTRPVHRNDKEAWAARENRRAEVIVYDK